MAIPLSDTARVLLNSPIFSVLSTVSPAGTPQSSVVWVRTDGDEIVFSTIRGRLKTRNMQRNPRVTLCAYDPEDPYTYVEVRGTVTMTEEGGVELIDALSRAYDDTPWRVRPDETRLVVRVTPTKVVERIGSQGKRRQPAG
jgi:PPOX class probable F420-dependent enzyme